LNPKSLLNVAVNVPLSTTFDYLPPADQPLPGAGCRVRVPFGRRDAVGMVLGQASESQIHSDKLRRCHNVLDTTPLLSAADLWLLRFTSDYYHHPIGEVVAAALPAALRQGKALHPTLDVVAVTDRGTTTDLEALCQRAPKQAQLLRAVVEAADARLDTDTLNALLPHWRRATRGWPTKDTSKRLSCVARRLRNDGKLRRNLDQP
jgi:primosomal protein N' (replication factor Y)